MGVLPGISAIIAGLTLTPGQQVFTTSGTFVVPDNCFVVSLVAVGCGGDNNTANRGGDLRWHAALPVTPGESLTVEISTNGGPTRVHRGGTDLLVARGGDSGTSTSTGGLIGGGDGGSAGSGAGSGSGGAGGYTGNGGRGSDGSGNGSPGSGGGGGGGGGQSTSGAGQHGGPGGGVGLLGAGPSGAGGVGGAGTGDPAKHGASGQGGSGGLPANNTTKTNNGGNYGGGSMEDGGGSPGGGAVRFIWGDGRAYPSTRTADE